MSAIVPANPISRQGVPTVVIAMRCTGVVLPPSHKRTFLRLGQSPFSAKNSFIRLRSERGCLLALFVRGC
jgi:hypothetical protein